MWANDLTGEVKKRELPLLWHLNQAVHEGICQRELGHIATEGL